MNLPITALEEKLMAVIIQDLQALDESTREKLFQLIKDKFCIHCGSDDPHCRCWDDS